MALFQIFVGEKYIVWCNTTDSARHQFPIKIILPHCLENQCHQ